MGSSENKVRWGLWLSAIGAGVATLYFGVWSLIHSFTSIDQSVSRYELDRGCILGIIATALIVSLLLTKKR